MSRRATGGQGSVREFAPPTPPLPADHVLSSGAVLFPGAFDQHGCPLIVFPVDGQVKLCSQLSKAEVVDFINYFLCWQNKKQEKESLVSVVADLSHASLSTTRFIAETLLLLELHKRMVHSVYIIHPKKKDVVKLLMKLLAPAKSHSPFFKIVLLREIKALSNYIDRSQLLASLGGYFIYCHQSWVAFIKEIDVFVQEFLSMVERLPSCISTLQSLSKLPLPSTLGELQHFSSTNEAKLQQLRRELGLDELLRHCDGIVEKLRCPEKDPCYQKMAGTSLFNHTTIDMLHNHNRITAAVEKVDLLWQQAFSQANLQLQVFQLQEDAMKIKEQMEMFLKEKVQPYKLEIAKDAARAAVLVSNFEASIHSPAMTHVHSAEDVIHTVAEILQFDGQSRERWVVDLERLKDKLRSAVHYILQTFKAVFSFHHYLNKAKSWYIQVLCENILQELLSGVNATQQHMRIYGTIPVWRHKLSTFLTKNPPPEMEELAHLVHLSKVIPDDAIQQEGKQISERCMTLRKLLISSAPVPVGQLQQALHWQYELLRNSHVNPSSAERVTHRTASDVQDSPSESNATKCKSGNEALDLIGTSPSAAASGIVSPEGTPCSLTSLDSGFDGARSSQLEACGGREGVEGLSNFAGNRDSVINASSHTKIHVSEPEDDRDQFDFGSVGNSSSASIQIIPKVTKDSLNFEIRVERSAAQPNNPWLSLPVDNLEKSVTVTITQNPTLQKTDLQLHTPPDPHLSVSNPKRSQHEHTKTDWMLHSESSYEDSELNPIDNILCSTITDNREKSSCYTDGMPTLLWDSYDLHDQNEESGESVMDTTQRDWDEKEQEGLTEVEKILGRADVILEEEENALAQEEVLEALLRSEDRHNHWPQWDSKTHLCMMSPSELTDIGVLSLEDCPEPEEPDNFGNPRSSEFTNEMNASEDDRHFIKAKTEANVGTLHSMVDLLTELRTVHILDELIMEENLKIHELKHSGENPNNKPLSSKPSETNNLLRESKEREAFRLQVEKEKMEVEKLEMSLVRECKMKKPTDRKIVRCSIMDKTRINYKEDLALYAGLFSKDALRSQKTHSEDTYKTDPGVAHEDKVQNRLPHCQDHTRCETDAPGASNSDLKRPLEEVGIQPQVCVNSANTDESNEKACKPETYLTPEMTPGDGTFDPGGKSKHSLTPLPRKCSLPVSNNFAEDKILHSTDEGNVAQPSGSQQSTLVHSDLVDESFKSLPENVTPDICPNSLSPNVEEDIKNIICHHPENVSLSLDHWTETNEDEAPSPSCLTQTNEDQTLDIEALSPTDECPQLPPDQPIEFDPGGIDELNEEFPNNFQRSEVLRTSASKLPEIQTWLNISTSKITDFKTPIVLDTGSGLMKAGFADQEFPNVVFPTIIGIPKYEEVMNGNLEKESYIGHMAQFMRGVLTLKHPIKNGIIRNWDEMENIWHHTFQQMHVDPEDHPVLLTEAAMNPVENRQRMVEIMFERFNVPFTYVAMQAVLALYAAGRSTGVVFDSGEGVSHSMPVFDGYCLSHAVQRFPLAGMDVTMQLRKLLQEQGMNMGTTAEMEIIREMKEKCCYVALNYEAELTQEGSSCREMHYTMPDGRTVTLFTERFRAPEILFKPELIGKDHFGMHESIFKSIHSSDIDLRRDFLGNIVLSGGNTLLPGLPQRLQAEIKGLVPADLRENVHVTSPTDRNFSVWSGGAVLVNLPTFSSAWISLEEYEEYGPQIVYRKCF